MLSGLKPVETTGGLCAWHECIKGTENERVLHNPKFSPSFHVHLEKWMKNLQSLMSASRGQALSSNSVEQGAVLIPHLLSFIHLFYKDQLQG